MAPAPTALPAPGLPVLLSAPLGVPLGVPLTAAGGAELLLPEELEPAGAAASPPPRLQALKASARVTASMRNPARGACVNGVMGKIPW